MPVKLISEKYFFYLPICLLVFMTLAVAPILKAADVVIYDFAKKAPEAKWYRFVSTAGELP